MKQLLTDVKAITLIAGSAAVSLAATALLLRGEPAPQKAECLTDLPELVSSFSISSSGGVALSVPGGGMETVILCGSLEDDGRKRRRHPHADRERDQIRVRIIEARERAEEAAGRAREARERSQEARVRVGEIQFRVQEALERVEEARDRAIERAMESESFGGREIEEAIERAMESLDEQEIEAAIERALESLDEAEVESRIEEQMRRLEGRLERVGNGGN
ncbi:MAG: hypothetical protein OEO23_08670 [Gemmatimonadota bacterium]|nr:hypothetical protein [Gemmatimonadota bacterium]